MKLIIDIDEQHFELLQMAVMNGMGDNAQKIIAQSIPLDKIRDEIEAYGDKLELCKASPSLEYILQIFDKYR